MAQSRRNKKGSDLVAVLLLTRSRPGPKLDFHYPAEPALTRASSDHHLDSDDTESEPESHDSASEKGANPKNGASAAGLEELNQDKNNDHATRTIFGHSEESLEKMLSPGRWCDQKKFEVCLNGLTFLGHPVYAPENGRWSEDDETQSSNRPNSTVAKPRYGDYHMYLAPGSSATSPAESSTPQEGTQHDFEHIPASFCSQAGLALGTSMDTASSNSGGGGDAMTMYHIVFVMQSSSPQHAKAMYSDVAKPLSKALQFCQKQNDYVAVEARRLLVLKAEAKQQRSSLQDLYAKMIESSEIAWSLKEIFDRISAREVAGIRLAGMEMSLSLGDSARDPDDNINVEPLSALLLLESKESLLLKLSHPDAAPLAHFLREHTPTKSLQKHASNIGMPINDVLFLGRHLLKWRKARVVSPLHPRNTYVVSPDAELGQLPSLAESYSNAFPTLPSLPNMLKVLSGKPIRYGLLIPSRDHRSAYMDILTFLVRHGLVSQLRTYGWLKLPRSLLFAEVKPDPNKRPISVTSLLSPQLWPADDDAISVSSERTTIAAPVSQRQSTKPLSAEEKESARASAQQLQSGKADQQIHSIITSPREPTDEEAKLMSAFSRTTGSLELRENLHAILPHLDGEHPFEEIAAREGLKRAKVEDWLSELEKTGQLMTVRYL